MASRADHVAFVPVTTNCPHQPPDSPFRRVSSLQPAKHSDRPQTKAMRRANSLVSSLDEQPTTDERSNMRAEGQGLKVRFAIETKEENTSHTESPSSTQLSDIVSPDDDLAKHQSRPERTAFRDMFRASFQRHIKRCKDGAEKADNDRQKDGGIASRLTLAVDNLAGISSMSNDTLNAQTPDHDSDSTLWSKISSHHRPYHFQRSQSTKSGGRSMTEEDEVETSGVARSVTEERFLYRSSFRFFRHLQLPATPRGRYCDHGHEPRDEDGSFFPLEHAGDKGDRPSTHPNAQNTHTKVPRYLPNTITQMLSGLFGHGRRPRVIAADSQRASRRRLTGHSLASVELGSWAARGPRRNSSLTPFCSTLSPTEASSRGEILQNVSSAIIHLFQRKHLKENELGVLQEHVRFLIRSEAGDLVHEYYKDQLLRKGMIILREKIKNEQGLELLKQLCETWEYFFREILPTLQAILYPLTELLAQDETIRSLTLLAFRNIVVLKVSIKEALDSVEKRTYPASTQQMLLVLQSIQDNVFLSENQFLLEKLVARVVCPYLGQRGLYEGSPEPVIKVKLKPIPIVIPSEKRVRAHSRQQTEKHTLPYPVSARKGDTINGTKLKPVLENVYDVGRRHSIVS